MVNMDIIMCRNQQSHTRAGSGRKIKDSDTDTNSIVNFLASEKMESKSSEGPTQFRRIQWTQTLDDSLLASASRSDHARRGYHGRLQTEWLAQHPDQHPA